MSSPSSPAAPGPAGLTLEAVEWLPSSGGSGLLRVRGRWAAPREGAELPELVLGEQRFASLPDTRGEAQWRAAFVLPAAALEGAEPWLEWPGGPRARVELPEGPAVAPAALAAAPAPAEPAGGQVIDRAVLAERRARRAEAAERAQARIAGEALKAVEVLEVRGAELERRVGELTGERAALAAQVDGEPAPPIDAEAEERARLRAERHREALTAALAEAARLRAQSREWRLRMRTSELARTADAVRLSVLDAEHTALVPQAQAARAEAAERAGELEAERARAAELAAALEDVRATAAAATASLASERAARAAAEQRLAERDAELATAVERLAAVREELEGTRAAAAELERRAADLERALDAERRLAETARADLEDARAASAAAAARSRVETVARAALDAELERERSARDALAIALDAEREHAAAAEPLRAEAAADAARLEGELATARDAALLARAELADERALRRRAEAELAADRSAAERQGTSLLDRIAELDRRAAGLADELSLQRAAREQAEALAAREPAPPDAAAAAGRVVADLDAAAAALREREPAAGLPPDPGPDAGVPPVRPIEAPSGSPPRPAATGGGARAYPWLRGALVKLAHDDPATAGRLLVALLPAQAPYVGEPLDYDLTITGTGTYAVTVAGARTFVKPRSAPRGRREAGFHLRADPLTLAELLAGVGPRVRRLSGPARLRGRRRRLAALERIPAAAGTLADAARAGARLEPGLVFAALPYAIHPAWTRGHRFTVAQEILGDTAQTRYVTVADGTVTAAAEAPAGGVDATVSLTQKGFEHLLRGEPPPPGHRPVVRGDRLAVAQLKAWTDRAQAPSP